MGASRKDIRFLGGWVGFQKSDITMLRQSLHWVKIGDGWVGRSKNGPKNRISFLDGPLAEDRATYTTVTQNIYGQS